MNRPLDPDSAQLAGELRVAEDREALGALRIALPLAIACLLIEATGHLVLDGYSARYVGAPLAVALLLATMSILRGRAPPSLMRPVWWLLVPPASGLTLAVLHPPSINVVLILAALLLTFSALVTRLGPWLCLLLALGGALTWETAQLTGLWGAIASVFTMIMALTLNRARREGLEQSCRQRLLEREVARRDEELDRLRGLTDLAGGFAHHFNNALAAIAGSIALAREDIGTTHPAQRELAEAESAMSGAARLVTDLLAYAGGGEADVREAVDVAALIRRAHLERLVPAGLTSAVRLEVDVRPDLDEMILDPDAVTRAVHHLVENAVESCAGRDTPGGTVRVVAALDHERSELHISVTDDGPGYAHRFESRLTQPFFTTKEPTRAGLGLSYCIGVARRHGGRLEHVSRPPRTTFALILPIVSGAAPEDRIAASSRAADGP